MFERTHVMAGLCAAVLVATFAPASVVARPSAQWNESLEVELSTFNCSSLGSPNVEKLSGSRVAWQGDPSMPPALGEVYYVKVEWSVLSPGCLSGGARVAPELFLPAAPPWRSAPPRR